MVSNLEREEHHDVALHPDHRLVFLEGCPDLFLPAQGQGLSRARIAGRSGFDVGGYASGAGTSSPWLRASGRATSPLDGSSELSLRPLLSFASSESVRVGQPRESEMRRLIRVAPRTPSRVDPL